MASVYVLSRPVARVFHAGVPGIRLSMPCWR
jgi:hypothetical protein